MANPKNLVIGNVLVNEKDGKKWTSIGLGSTGNKDPKYDTFVEVTVKNSAGQVLSTQVNGFINIQDPRKLPSELLAAGKISEEIAASMEERAARLPAKIKQQLVVKTTS